MTAFDQGQAEAMDTRPARRPLRVLYIARAPFVSGAERALVSMLRAFGWHNVKPSVVLGNDTELRGIIDEIGVPVDVVRLPKRDTRGVFQWWRSLRVLQGVIDRVQPDILHANDVPSCQAMSELGAKLGIPRVIHVRWTITAQDMAWWARRGAEAVVCISEYIHRELGNPAGTPLAQARFDIVPDAVTWAGESVHAEASGDAGVAPPRDPSQPIQLGFAGQLIPSKGLDLVIEGLAKVESSKRPRLLIAGEDTQRGGEYKAELQALSRDRKVDDAIQWLGFLDDVSELYGRIDAVVCPSREEPLGLVPLEAAQYRKPAIANRVGGLAETIQHNQTGILVDPKAEAWGEALGELTQREDLPVMGQAAWVRTRQRYSPMVYERRLMEIYRAIAKS